MILEYECIKNFKNDKKYQESNCLRWNKCVRVALIIF